MRIRIFFVPAALAGINGAVIMAAGAFSIMDGLMSIGIFVAFQSLMQDFQAPVERIAGMSQDIQDTSSQMLKINDVYRYPLVEEPHLDNTSLQIFPAKLSGKLELKDLTFGYAKKLARCHKKIQSHAGTGAAGSYCRQKRQWQVYLG